MDRQEDLKILRSDLLTLIPDILGMSHRNFNELVSTYLNKSSDGGPLSASALDQARKRESMSYSYEAFSTALDNAMEYYLNQRFQQRSAKAAKQAATRQNWEENREVIHLLIASVYTAPGAPLIPYKTELDEAMDRLVRSWESRFMALDPWTAARVERNFSLLDDVTGDDSAFVSSLLKLTEAERAHLGEWLPSLDCPTAGVMLERIDPKELSFWKGLWSRACWGGKVPLTGESWIRFKEKVRALPLDRALALLMFLDYILPAQDGVAARFGPEGMDLFLMFKFFLTEDGRGAVLDWLKARTEKGPGQ